MMRRKSIGEWRWNVALSAGLLLLVLVLGNRIAREHLRLRLDMSEDQLFAPGDVGRKMMTELKDVLQVKAFFTGEVRLGPVQIAKRRLIDQLEEFVDVSDGRLELTFVDPNSSTEARAEAQGLGIQALPMGGVQGTTEVTQDVYLGVLLRYRGREVVVPFVLPQTFEYAFLGGVRKLLREVDVTVGFLTGTGQGDGDTFTEIRRQLGGQYKLRELLDLELGAEVPADVSVMVVARPLDLHPRAVFAVDQFLQRGGRALFLLDPVVVDLTQGRIYQMTTGLDDTLAAWGVTPSVGFVWDAGRANRITTRETVQVGGQDRTLASASIPYPFWPNVGPAGLDGAMPATARLPGADLFWVHALASRPVAGLEHQPLLWSSDTAWVVPCDEALTIDPRALSARSADLLARGDAGRRTLAMLVTGTFPSAFTGGAPAPLDPIAEALHADRVERALAAGNEPPVREVELTDEEVADRASATQVILFGDADWTTDGKFLKERNRMLFGNLVDWLALEDDLIALRSRVPIQRTLDDLLELERRELGLLGPRVEVSGADGQAIASMESEAENRARARRRLLMLYATGGSLLGALLLGCAWRFTFGRGPHLVA